ncbi:MAG: hypothetical protein HFF08_10475 [Oscillospiraceae bacterium]|nr:hypothetical protein [Oscillospiraceae bacterium]
MNTTIYTPEVMAQTGRIYDRLEQLPLDKRPIVELVTETFINGMNAQKMLDRMERERVGA